MPRQSARVREQLDEAECEIRSMAESGQSQRSVADQLGVPRHVLSRWSKRHGVGWGPIPAGAASQAERITAARLALAERTLLDALSVREQLWADRAPTPRELLDVAGAVERLTRSAVHAAGTAEDASRTEERRNMLTRLHSQIKRAVHPEETP